MARSVVAHLFMSLDGVVESPNLWQFDAFGADEAELMGRVLAPVTDVVIGRVLWDEWSTIFPGSDDPFGAFINPVRKHVAGATLSRELGWNSTVIVGDVVDHVRHMKAAGGGDIAVAGGIETVRSLFLAGVVDRLILTTHPVIAGAGRHLFEPPTPPTRLTLTSAIATASGNAVLTYALRNAI